MTITNTKATGGVALMDSGTCTYSSIKSGLNYSTTEDNLGLLLSQLTKVKQNGRGQYIACCPSHDDKHPSLAIRQTDDGKILLKCFCGCSAYEIVSAIGLSLTDLFPKESNYSTPIKNPFPAASKMANGAVLPKEDLERLVIAASRIGGAYE